MADWFIPEWMTDRIAVVGGGTTGYVPEGVFTIGVNDSYFDGTDVCIWGDEKWYRSHIAELMDTDGLVVGICPARVPHSNAMNRIGNAWGFGWNLGWWGNTGCSAINLAVSMGARRVELYGFDLRMVDGRTNRYDTLSDQRQSRMDSMLEEFEKMSRCVPSWVEVDVMTPNSRLFSEKIFGA